MGFLEDFELRMSGTDAGASAAVRNLADEFDHLRGSATPGQDALDRLAKTEEKLEEKSHRAAAAHKEHADALSELKHHLIEFVVAGEAVNLVKEAINEGFETTKMSQTLSESVASLQRLKTVATDAGVSMSSVVSSFEMMERNVGDGANDKAAAAMKNLGLETESFMALPIDERVLALAEAFQEARNEGTAVKDVMTLMGRGGKELIPILAMGKEKIEELFGEHIVSDMQIAELDMLHRKFTSTWEQVLRGTQEFVADFAGMFQGVWIGATQGIEALNAAENEEINKVGRAAFEMERNRRLEAKAMAEARAKDQEEAAQKAEDKKREKEEKAEEKRVEANKKIQEKIEELHRKTIEMGMTDEERYQELFQKRIKLVDEWGKAAAAGDKDKVLRIRLNVEEVDNDMAKINRDAAKEKEREKKKEDDKAQRDAEKMQRDNERYAERIQEALPDEEEKLRKAQDDFRTKQAKSVVADSFTAIGGGGGAFSPALTDSQKQVSVLEDAVDILRDIYDRMNRGESNPFSVSVED